MTTRMSSGDCGVLCDQVDGVESDDMEEERRARLAYVIRAGRERRGLAVHELADALGVAHSTVYAWEKGDKAPSLLALGPLCDALGVSPELFRDLPEEPPSPVEQYLVQAAGEGARQGAQRAAKRRPR